MSPNQDEEMHAVLIRRKDGSEFFALGRQAGPALFYRWRAANDFRRELRAEKLAARVCRVRVKIEVMGGNR